MAIPESQLESWSRQGAITTAKTTHESIRNALNSYQWPTDINYEIYLQGSYKNSTNIRGDSDVDVVIQLNSTFLGDLSLLSIGEKEIYNKYRNATYYWSSFRSDVLKALRKYYGQANISEGNKSIKIIGGSNRLSSDVVVAIQYRKYYRIYSFGNEDYIEGIVFWTKREGRQIINYPKLHYYNGVIKMAKTKNWYKPFVRIIKNARTYLINLGLISSDIAPSYFIECLLYNVPNDYFALSYQYCFENIISFLHYSLLNACHNFLCQNEMVYLFDNSEGQWNVNNAIELVAALQCLWDNW